MARADSRSGARHASTLVIGSGFAGRAVASCLAGQDVLIVERGEARSFGDSRVLFRQGHDPAAPFWVNARPAWRSALSFNRTYALSSRCFSQFEFIAGGSSNRWTGRAVRLNRQAFVPRHDGFDWPFGYDELTPYFRAAERRLNVAFDPLDSMAPEGANPIANTAYWRELLSPHFETVRVDPQAKNVGRPRTARQGRCCGAGDCEACPTDAKSRPDTVFEPATTLHGHLVQELVFEGQRAVAARCLTTEGERWLSFDRVVVAAHAVESVALLGRSRIPGAAPGHRIGTNFQDHALVQFLVKLRRPVDYRSLGVMGYASLGGLSGVHEGLEVEVYAHVEQPTPAHYRAALDSVLFRRQGAAAAAADLEGLLVLDALLEMPPELGLRIDTSGSHPRVDDRRYPTLVPRYDDIVRRLVAMLEARGLPVAQVLPHYRHTYGTHHLMGTLPLGGAVDPDFRLSGTANVYVAGASLFPRVGAQNPTVTLTALAFKLGETLATR